MSIIRHIMSDKPDNKPKFESEDRKNLNSYYSFKMDQAKFDLIKSRSRKQISRFAVTGVIFGFITEYMLGNSTIYSNIVKKATLRRLKAKRKEDFKLEEKVKLKAGNKIQTL